MKILCILLLLLLSIQSIVSVGGCSTECGKPCKPLENETGTVGDAPWNVAIYRKISNEQPELICGATIIDENFIVSADHCFRNEFRALYNETHFEAVVSKKSRNYSLIDNAWTKRYKIKKIYIPDANVLSQGDDPYSQSGMYAGDIALLKTSEKISFNKFVHAICIDWNSYGPFNPITEVNGKLVGWGQNSNGEPSETLLSVILPYMKRSECLYNLKPQTKHDLTDDKFCAGTTSGPGAKPGDSGGGLVFRNANTQSYVLRGVVSSKENSANSLAMFTDFGLYKSWIESIQFPE